MSCKEQEKDCFSSQHLFIDDVLTSLSPTSSKTLLRCIIVYKLQDLVKIDSAQGSKCQDQHSNSIQKTVRSLSTVTYQYVELPTASHRVLRARSISCCTDSLIRQAGRHRLHAESCFVFSIIISSFAVSCFTFTSEPGAGSFGRRSL